MTTNTNSFAPDHTAQILAFPIRARVAARASTQQRFAAMEEAARRHPVSTACGSSYHDEAITEASRDRSSKLSW